MRYLFTQKSHVPLLEYAGAFGLKDRGSTTGCCIARQGYSNRLKRNAPGVHLENLSARTHEYPLEKLRSGGKKFVF